MITSAHDTPDMQLAKRRGYLVSRNKQPRERWYGYCQAQRLPFMIVQGQKYAKITCDLFPAKRVFCLRAPDVVVEAWRAARLSFRGGRLAMTSDRLDVYRLPMAGVERFLHTLTEVIRLQTDMEPCLKEHVRGIVGHCREAGYPLQLFTNGQGGGVVMWTLALPRELLRQVEQYRREITMFLTAAQEEPQC
ncbi:MAG: hypothetical protein ACRERE_44895 [Candidatus Entotheonellia bacterium]